MPHADLDPERIDDIDLPGFVERRLLAADHPFVRLSA